MSSPDPEYALWCARRVSGLTLHELGEAVGGMKMAAVSKAISRLEQQAVEENDLRAMQQRLIDMSNVQGLLPKTLKNLYNDRLTFSQTATHSVRTCLYDRFPSVVI